MIVLKSHDAASDVRMRPCTAGRWASAAAPGSGMARLRPGPTQDEDVVYMSVLYVEQQHQEQQLK